MLWQRIPSVRGWTAVLAVNIDHFADIATRLGDRSGDHSGDSFVAEVARRLELSLRRRDGSRPMDTLAHTGGDHFLVLCEDVADASAAKMIARRIAGALVAPLSIAGEELSVTACIGITLTREPGRDAEPLIREAEAAMQRAQRRGAGRHEMFTGEMHAQRLVRIANELSLRQALVRGEFYVEYQPKVSLVTDRTVGVEALLRWMHPERGLISPLDFIPLAEESGIIVQIGAWVLEQVCRDAIRWRTALPGGQPLMVAVNVSPRQFESDLAETFGGIIGRSGIDPATVCLEVTESMVMQDAELAIATLRELKSLGLEHLGRRLRHRVLVARVSQTISARRAQDRQVVRRRPRARFRGNGDRRCGDGHGPRARSPSGGGGRRDSGSGRQAAHAGVRRGAGILLCTARVRQSPSMRGSWPKRGPMSEERRSRHEKGAESAHIGKILVVDDADDVRQLARSSLAAVGFEVREAASGEDAVTMARHFKPDCLVLDVNLPGISGFDVCRILRDDLANQRTTIVILTGDAAPSEKVMAFSLEADDYMVKPFSPRDLVSRVTVAIRRRGEMFASKTQ